MTAPADAAHAAAEATVAMYDLNGRRDGDYVMVIKSTITEEEGLTYTWDWWWRPPGTVNMEGAGSS